MPRRVQFLYDRFFDNIWNYGLKELNEDDKKVRQDEDIYRKNIAFRVSIADIPTVTLADEKTNVRILSIGAPYDRLKFPAGVDESCPPYIDTFAEFKLQFSTICMGLDELFWDLPLVAAGGAVLYALHLSPRVQVPSYVRAHVNRNGDVYKSFVKQHGRCFGVSVGFIKLIDGEWNIRGTKMPKDKFDNACKLALENKITNIDGLDTYGNQLQFIKDVNERPWLLLQKPVKDVIITKHEEQTMGMLAFMHGVSWYADDNTKPVYTHDRKKPHLIPLTRDLADHSPSGGEIWGLFGGGNIEPYKFGELPDCLLRDIQRLIYAYVGADHWELLSYTRTLGRTLRSFRSTDIDLFLTTSLPEVAIATIHKLYERLKKAVPEIKIYYSTNATTFVLRAPYRNIQVIHRLYKDAGHVLLGFDIDCCAVAYNGREVLTSPRGLRALQTRQNIVDVTRQSTTYEARLFKYARRGFSVAVPGLDIETRFETVKDALMYSKKIVGRCDSCGESCRACRDRETTPHFVGVDRLIGMLMLAQSRLNAVSHPTRRTARAASMFETSDSVSDYCSAVGGRSVPAHATVLPNGRYVDFIPETIEFAPVAHVQGRETTLMTGSFNPTQSDWYNGKE